MVVGFFSDLHRSIFDRNFYREVPERPVGRVVLFVFKMLFFTALVLGVAHTYYISHTGRGIAPLVSAVFGGVEIRDGRLQTDLPQPYGVRGEAFTLLLNRMMGHSRFFEGMPDGYMVIDTRPAQAPADGEADGAAGAAAPQIVLGETAVAFRGMGMAVPYSAIIDGGNFKFTAEAVQEYLNKNVVQFLIHFFLLGLFFTTFTMFLSAFFLSLAAYIFSVERAKGFRHFAKLACFAVTPVTLGSAAVAVSGVADAEWTWHVFVIISTVIMFRAMVSTAGKAPEEKKEAPQ